MVKIVFVNAWGNWMRDELVPFIQEQASDTDIFCLQEAMPIVKERCAPALEGYAEMSDNKYVSDVDHFPLSIFVRKNINVIDYGTLMQEKTDRGLAIYIEIEVNGKRVFICNVHGKSRPGEKLDDEGRIAQSEDIVGAFKDREAPVIIGGDFNMLPDTTGIRMFAENGYRNLITEYEIETTRNHFAWDRHPTKLLFSDYVFVKGGLTVDKFEVPQNEVSDHLPLIMNVALQ